MVLVSRRLGQWGVAEGGSRQSEVRKATLLALEARNVAFLAPAGSAEGSGR